MDFLADFLRLFDEPINLSFNTAGTKDMHPVNWKKTENGYRAICRTVGISKEDLKVDFVENTIRVSGKTKYNDEEYSINYSIPISREIVKNIEKINYKTENGLTYINLIVKKEIKPTISIEKLD